MSATSRAEIGSRGFAFRSWRAYGKSGTTAVMRFADASFAAWIISISSIRFRSTGMLPVCTRKMSAPRIDSLYRQYVSSFLNVSSSTPPSSSPRCSAIAPARSGCERPAKTIRRFCGPRSIQCPGDDSVMDAFSSPGRASSAVSVRLTMLLVDPAFLGLLARREPGERSGGDIICDDRTRRNPSVVANVDRSIERIVDTGPDVAADPSRALRQTRFVGEIGRDVARRDVRIFADLGVSEVREVRNLGAGADAGLLQLDERAGLRPLPEHRARAEIREGADGDVAADRSAHRDDVGPYLRARSNGRSPAQHRERLDRRVRLDLHVRVDPRGGGIDDRDAGEHVRLVDPVAEARGDERELGTGVDPFDLPRDGGGVHGDGVAATDEQSERVGDVELALRVVRLEPVESGPQLLVAEHVDARVRLVELELGRRRV